MIKMIASDLDGTLVPEGTSGINPELYDVIKQLIEKDILFVAASGRQYTSMLHILEPVRDDIVFITDNGAGIIYKDEILYSNALKKDVIRDLCAYLNEQGFLYMAATFDKGYSDSILFTETESASEGYGIRTVKVADLTALDTPILKLAVNTGDTDAVIAAEPLKEMFGDRVEVSVSAFSWINILALGNSKGSALQFVQEKWDICRDETVCFGDNINDIPLLQRATLSYAVKDARPQTKEAATCVLKDDIWDAVINTMKTML